MFKYIKQDGKLIPDASETQARQIAIQQAPEGSIWYLYQHVLEEARTSESNRYLWGVVYQSFVPEHFDTCLEAHKYFTEKFLGRESIININEESLNEELSEIISKSSQTHKPKIKKINDTIEVKWVLSTASLSKKKFNEYITQVKIFANELGINFGD